MELNYTVVTSHKAIVCGCTLEHEATGAAMLVELYRAHVGDWPKFFKMDTLSKTGFLASELLLKECGAEALKGEEFTSETAVVLFGTTASLCADINYQQTIQDSQNYYPSPALFVYTLPNIVTGEIAIRNHYRGETSFYVLDGFDAASMAFHLGCAFQDGVTKQVLVGWLDSTGNDEFCSFFTLINRDDVADLDELESKLNRIMNNLK